MGDLDKTRMIVRNKEDGTLMGISVYDIAIVWGSRAYELMFGRKGRAQGMLHNGKFFETVNPAMLANDRNTGELSGHD